MTTHPGARHITPLTPGRPNSARQVTALAVDMGLRPDLWWQWQLAALMTEQLPGRRRDGRRRYAYQTFLVSIQRRAGKTTIRVPIVVHRCMIQPGARCWSTAQTRQDARDYLVDESGPLVTASAYVNRRVRLRQSQGSEGWTFANRSSWRVFAPGDKSIHGKSSDLVDVDEGWALSVAQGKALTQGASATKITGGGQLTIQSTVGPSLRSAWFNGKLAEARAAHSTGAREGIAIIEYALAPELVEATRDQLEQGTDTPPWWDALRTLAAHHPAYGHQIERVEDLAAYARDEGMDADAIMRALGNIPPEQSTAALPYPRWLQLQALAWPTRPDRVVFGIDVGMDRTDATITAGWAQDGTVYVDVVAHQDGAEWVTATMRQLGEHYPRAQVYGAPGPAADTLAQLARDGFNVTVLPAGRYTEACQGLVDDVLDGARLAHPGAPALNDAVRVAATRTSADRVVFSRSGSAGSISALVAATVTRYGVLTAAPAPPAPQIYGG